MRTPREQRDAVLAIILAGYLVAGIGTSFGLIVGGVLTEALSWRYGFFLNVPVGLAAILAAPRFLPETERHAGHLDLSGAIASTLGAGALVFGIVHSADAGWRAGSTIAAWRPASSSSSCSSAASGVPRSRSRRCACSPTAGAYAARFLFNAVLVSFFFFMTQYLQGVSGDTPLRARLAFLPVTAAAFAAAALIPRAARRIGNDVLAIAGCAAMLGTARMSRGTPVSPAAS